MNEITTDKYWDCECEKDYIHPKSQNVCAICGCNKEDQPDSIISEVEALNNSRPEWTAEEILRREG